MYRKATAFHSSEPCHLPFGKLMNGDFKSTEYLFKTDFPNYIFRDIFIFQTIINKVCSRNPRIKQSLDLIYHSTVKPFLQTPANLGTTGITVNSYTDNDGFYCRERSILRGVFKIVGFNLYRPDYASCCHFVASNASASLSALQAIYPLKHRAIPDFEEQEKDGIP